MLHWDAASGTGNYLNANPDHPTGGSTLVGGSPDTSGERVAVPGTVAGMRAAADRFGTRPWKSYFAPAIAAAEEGFTMYGQLAGALAAAQPRITVHLSGRERYMPDGLLPAVGQRFRQPRLAATLGRISEADGVEWFQYGAFAEHFATAVHSTGGTMTTADLAATSHAGLTRCGSATPVKMSSRRRRPTPVVCTARLRWASSSEPGLTAADLGRSRRRRWR